MHSSLEYRKAMSQHRTRRALAMSLTGFGDGRKACLRQSRIFEQAFPCHLDFLSKDIGLCNAIGSSDLRSGFAPTRQLLPGLLEENEQARPKELAHQPEL